MRPEERDPGYVWDMLDAARSVREFTTGVTQDEYLEDRKLQLAIERALEIIGEAARLVSPTFKANHAKIPWKEIIGQRNVLAHEYGEINQARIWLVASRRIPELIELLEPLLPPPPTV
jgi:uncharacterized protein with HEPN domain